jgi:hypothetical protein
MGDYDGFIRKYDSEGNVSWTRQLGTSAFDMATAVAADVSGVYVAGQTDGTLPDQTSTGFADAFVRKYDVGGNVVWTRQFGSSSGAAATSISAIPSGVYVAGQTVGALPDQMSSGFTDAFVRKYDADGSAVWTRQIGPSSYVGGISAGASGVHVGGWTERALPGQVNAGRGDIFLAAVGVDATPPAVVIVFPTEGSVVTSSRVSVVWTASDATSGIDRIEMSVAGGSPQTLAGTATAQQVTLADGAHMVTITAIDRVGNSASMTVSFRVDTSFFSPSGPYGYSGIATVTVIAAVAALAVVYTLRKRRKPKAPKQAR